MSCTPFRGPKYSGPYEPIQHDHHIHRPRDKSRRVSRSNVHATSPSLNKGSNAMRELPLSRRVAKLLDSKAKATNRSVPRLDLLLLSSPRFDPIRSRILIDMGRGYSYSPSPPPRSYRGRARSPSPRGRYGGRGRDLPTSLLVRNLRRDCRPEDLRRPFGQFGRLKDIYIPRDYYSGEPRGFGFVQYFDPDDAADAKYYMDGQVVLGREIVVVFAQENRKKPSEMRTRESSRGRSYDRRYSPSPRGRSPFRGQSYSRSPSPRYARRRFREESYSRSPVDGGSRSGSPLDEHYSRSARREGSLSVSG